MNFLILFFFFFWNMAGRADTHFFSNTTEVERARIKLAENASDSDKLSAMKTLVQVSNSTNYTFI